ncbi:uncharacterized protein LOC132748886 [Ruditapes philippinarum]|uniref:uncharacterized protein LOC132748886 n=1 Tax=Ruditapes philippinarum TaxID=129788 RepID=UPI00295B2C68|nr:uncharacterized protein LOC132748886 [Ruditapes philippinarum]
MIISTSGKMADITAFILVFTAVFSLGNSLPVERDVTPPPSSSFVCSSVYHGQCINTYEFQCMGLAIPGVCGNTTSEHFNSISFGALTAIQCCNSWQVPQVGSADGGNSGNPFGR